MANGSRTRRWWPGNAERHVLELRLEQISAIFYFISFCFTQRSGILKGVAFGFESNFLECSEDSLECFVHVN